jgi:hypothetical protein
VADLVVQRVRTLPCVNTDAAVIVVKQLASAGYDDARAAGRDVTFTAHPLDALHVAEWAHANNHASDADAGRLIGSL